MINVKKIAKGVGVVLLVFFLAILAYTFTPFLALLIVAMESISLVLLNLTIVLIFLTIIKILIQVLTGNKIHIKIIQNLHSKFSKMKKTEEQV